MTTILHRLIGALGRLLITIGLLVLAFAGFQYWGTGLAEARAQEELNQEFLVRLADVRDRDSADTEAESGTGGALDTTTDAVSPVEPPPVIDTAPMLDLNDIPEPGEAAGRIIIPAIGVDKTYVRGVDRDDLRQGPGHYPLSVFPGQAGNAAIAGHRTTYGAPFLDLDKLVPGDEIIVETLQGRFRYLVNSHESQGAEGGPVGHFIVDPRATWVLDDHGDSRLTLTACHPKRSAAQRIIVTATLETRPAPPTPLPDPPDTESGVSHDLNRDPGEEPAVDDLVGVDEHSLDGSLGWRPEHGPATALWAGVSTLVALAGWGSGRRWRRVPAYAVSTPPFLACLFLCFTHLDRLLPAI